MFRISSATVSPKSLWPQSRALPLVGSMPCIPTSSLSMAFKLSNAGPAIYGQHHVPGYLCTNTILERFQALQLRTYIVFCAVHLSDLDAWSTQSSELSSCFVSPKRAQVVKEQSLKEFPWPVDPYSSLFSFWVRYYNCYKRSQGN